MIKKIAITNFFSFGQSEIELNPEVNILVGINGTGKSNFIKAIRLLYEGVAGAGLEKLIMEQWGGFDEMVHFGNTSTDEIILTYVFEPIDSSNYGFESYDSSNGDVTYEIHIQKSSMNGLYRLVEKVYDSKQVYLDRDEHNQVTTIKSAAPVVYPKIFELAMKMDIFVDVLQLLKYIIFDLSIYNYFDTSPNSLIRQLSPFYSESKLLNDGRNLTHLLNDIKINNSRDYAQITQLLGGTINPNFESLEFSVQNIGKTLMYLKEKDMIRAIPISQISDGTLRFLLLAAIFYNSRGSKLVCIDEPETGLHPDMISAVADAMKYAAGNGMQIIATTHSPLLLNNFDLEDIKIFEKGTHNQTVVCSKSEEDFADWQGEFLAGQMWLRGQLGGTRW